MSYPPISRYTPSPRGEYLLDEPFLQIYLFPLFPMRPLYLFLRFRYPFLFSPCWSLASLHLFTNSMPSPYSSWKIELKRFLWLFHVSSLPYQKCEIMFENCFTTPSMTTVLLRARSTSKTSVSQTWHFGIWKVQPFHGQAQNQGDIFLAFCDRFSWVFIHLGRKLEIIFH
jgi:hypothetical protein